MNCEPTWKCTSEEYKALRNQWEPLLKNEGQRKGGYAQYTCVVSAPQGSNPPCLALVSAADGWSSGHFGGRASLTKTENNRDFYLVVVYTD